MPRGDGTRRGAAARSGPSGEPIPDAQRQRPPIRLTLSGEEHALLLSLAQLWECSRSEAVGRLLRQQQGRG